MNGAKRAAALAVQAAAVGAVALVLAACESKVDKVCPDFARLKDTERLTMFRGGSGRDISDILYEAEVNTVALTCRSTDEALRLDVTIGVVAQRGPTSDATEAELPVFAVAARNDKVLVRTGDTLDLSFDGSGAAAEQTSVSFEVPRQDGDSPKSIEVLVGFVLSRDQVAFNRFRNGAVPAPTGAAAPLDVPEAVLPPQ